MPQFKLSAPATLVRYDHRFVYEVRSLKVIGITQSENPYWHCTGVCHGSLLHPRTVRRGDSVNFSGFRFYFDSKASLEVYVLGKDKNGTITTAIGRIEDAGVTIQHAHKSYSFHVFQRYGCLRPKVSHKRVTLKVVPCPSASSSGTSSGGGSGSSGGGSGSSGGGSGSSGGGSGSSGSGSGSSGGGSGSSGGGSGSGTSAGSPTTAIPAPTAATYAFGVALKGSGDGSVGAPGLSCSGSTCTGSAIAGQVVTLTESPTAGSTFAGWGGACTGTDTTCSFVLSSGATATATFDLIQEPVTVTESGSGTGTVDGTGISCGALCSTNVGYGQTETLIATPSNGSTFAGWSGACTGTGTTCSFVLSSGVTATATFDLNQESVTVTDAGSGTVVGAGILCGSLCSTSVDFGQSETLVAVPSVGSTFAGWSGACTGTGICTVTPSAATAVTATFTTDLETLTVDQLGPAAGSVSGSGISCGVTCSITVPYGTTVSLAPSSPWDVDFGGWQGAGCSGSGGCSITVTSATTVGATFSGYYETTPSQAETFSSPTTAGGVAGEGPAIVGDATVQVACVAQGAPASDGNTNWYLIAASPWDSDYYVSADTFENSDPTLSSLPGATPPVDPAVPACPQGPSSAAPA